MVELGRHPCHREIRLRPRPRQFHGARLQSSGGRRGQARSTATRQTAERPRRGLPDLIRIHGAHHHEGEILGVVETPVEPNELVSRQGADEIRRADDGTAVRVTFEERLVRLSEQKAHRAVLAQPDLLEHDALLGFEQCFVQTRVHSDVGQDLDAASGRQHHVVVRVVERRAGIHASTGALDLPVDQAPGPRRCSLEEHVLEIVSEAELVGGLVTPSRFDPQLHGHDIARSVLFDDDADAVGQHVPYGAGDLRWKQRRPLRGTRAREQRRKHDEQRERDARRDGH